MIRGLFVLSALLLPALAQPHSRSESFSHWQVSGNDVIASITMAAREVTRLPAYEGSSAPASLVFADHLRARVRVRSAAKDCRFRSHNALAAAPGFVTVELRFRCDASPVAVSYLGMFEVVPSHVHYARMFSEGKMRAEALLTGAESTWWLAGDGAHQEQASFPAWLRLGIDHIGSGYDHIAFIIGLLLVAGSLRNALVAVTGFTLGHSISLAAAVYGLISADAALVEAFIGFTVSLVAVEFFIRRSNSPDAVPIPALFSLFAALVVVCGLLLRVIDTSTTVACLGMAIFAYCYLSLAAGLPERRRGPVLLLAAAGMFGLIHGLGFAGFLIHSGALGASLALPLIGFNIGVEVGQIAIVGGLILLARLGKPLTHPLAAQWVASSLCAAGIYWYVTRTIG